MQGINYETFFLADFTLLTPPPFCVLWEQLFWGITKALVAALIQFYFAEFKHPPQREVKLHEGMR